jgi:stage II sporulation protein D
MRRFIVVSTLTVALSAAVPIASFASSQPTAIVVDGHGFGHGRGMGQYGARALASAGFNWKQILRFYYAGAPIKKIARGPMRVLLQHTKGVTLTGDPHLSIAAGNGKTIVATNRGSLYFHVALAGKSSIVSLGTSPTGPWRRIAGVRSGTVSVRGGRAAGLVGSSSIRWYGGALELVPSGAGYDIVDNVSLEQYVSEVVPREMPASWPMDALRAQAVAARTYAVRVAKFARAMHQNYDICASTACQVFGGYAITDGGSYRLLESPSSNAATHSTAGWIMTWGGKPIFAEYSSTTGGYTAAGSVPYLTSHPDPWDNSSPLHSWSDAITPQEISANWPMIGSFRGVRVVARDGHGDWGGRVRTVAISGSRGTIRVSGAEFESAFGFPSDWFRFRSMPRVSQYRFTFDMGRGTNDIAVQFLQQRLRAAGFFPKGTRFTMYFGAITEAALKAYQRAHHIPATGYLGPTTRERLNSTR